MNAIPAALVLAGAVLLAGALICAAIEGWHQLAERKARRRG